MHLSTERLSCFVFPVKLELVFHFQKPYFPRAYMSLEFQLWLMLFYWKLTDSDSFQVSTKSEFSQSFIVDLS